MLQLGIVLPIILKRISIDDSNKGQEEFVITTTKVLQIGSH